jgi:hypothetical protein
MDRELRPGERVNFRLGDIHLPDLAEVIARMTEDTELQGTVSLLSDQGGHRAAFAVIEVKGILMPLIVPASCIKRLADATQNAEAAPAADEKDWGLSVDR